MIQNYFSVSKSALIRSAGNDTSSRTCMGTSRDERGRGPGCRGDAAAGAPHPRIMQVRMQNRAAQSCPESPTAVVRTYHEDAPLRACFLAFSRNAPPFGIPPPPIISFRCCCSSIEWNGMALAKNLSAPVPERNRTCTRIIKQAIQTASMAWPPCHHPSISASASVGTQYPELLIHVAQASSFPYINNTQLF